MDRINAFVKLGRGIERQLRHTHPNCRACIIGSAREPSTKLPTTRQYFYYGECIASDLCEMPTFSPFGFRYVLCFYDLATKHLEVYYLRNAIAAEVASGLLQDVSC
eukprot:950606-Pleurochrysis_carterae.AAC.1